MNKIILAVLLLGASQALAQNRPEYTLGASVGTQVIGGRDANGKVHALQVDSTGVATCSVIGIPVIAWDGGMATQGPGTNGVAWLVYFDGGTVKADQGAAGSSPWQVYFDGGAVNASQAGTWSVSFNDAGLVQWSCNINSDAGITLCKGAPGASTSLYITDVVMSPGASATTVALTTGASTVCDGGTVATIAGTYTFPASASPMTLDFQTPIKLTANQAVCVSASLPTSVTINGFIAP